MLEIPINDATERDYDTVVKEVLRQLETGKDKYGEGCIGTAYIDWGAAGETYRNCPSRSIADKVAYDFKDKGYYVYVQRMGEGVKPIPYGTPICYRIYKEARIYNNWEEL